MIFIVFCMSKCNCLTEDGMMLEGSGRETVEQLFGILSAKHII